MATVKCLVENVGINQLNNETEIDAVLVPQTAGTTFFVDKEAKIDVHISNAHPTLIAMFTDGGYVQITIEEAVE